jgi:hypothetical protein
MVYDVITKINLDICKPVYYVEAKIKKSSRLLEAKNCD